MSLIKNGIKKNSKSVNEEDSKSGNEEEGYQLYSGCHILPGSQPDTCTVNITTSIVPNANEENDRFYPPNCHEMGGKPEDTINVEGTEYKVLKKFKHQCNKFRKKDFSLENDLACSDITKEEFERKKEDLSQESIYFVKTIYNVPYKHGPKVVREALRLTGRELEKHRQDQVKIGGKAKNLASINTVRSYVNSTLPPEYQNHNASCDRHFISPEYYFSFGINQNSEDDFYCINDLSKKKKVILQLV